MKKGLLLGTATIALLAAGAVFLPRLLDDRAIAPENLPEKQETFLAANFPEQTISFVKEDRDFLLKKYEVLLSDGTKVEFQRNGDWKEIKRRGAAVPESLIPAEVLQKVRELYPDTFIVKAECDRNGLDIRLSNGFELEFNRKLVLVDMER